MGRGLSELQKAILKLAWDELEELRKAKMEVYKDPELLAEWREYYAHGRGVRPDKPALAVMAKDNWMGYISTDDIFIKIYGWVPKYKYGNRFSKSEIGLKPYMAAYIAVRKSLDRLKARGLMYSSNRQYIALTKAGENLSAKLAGVDSPVKLRYLEDVNPLTTGGYMHPKDKIIEVPKYEAELMVLRGSFELV